MKIYLSSMKLDTIMCFKVSIIKFKKVIKLHLLEHLAVESQQFCNLFNVFTSQKRAESLLMEMTLKIMIFITLGQVWVLLVNSLLCLMEVSNITSSTIFLMFQHKKSFKSQEVQMHFHLLWVRRNFRKSNLRRNKRQLEKINKTIKSKLQTQVRQVLIEV